MVHFQSNDDPTADSATPLYPTDSDSSLLTPNRGEFDDEKTTLNGQDTNNFPIQQGSYSDPPQSKTLFRRFEKPGFARIAILAALCVVTYPVLYVVTLVAKDLPLFTVRVIVAVGCSAIGFALRYSLIGIGVRHIEAATWATLIQMSFQESGMKLGDLARTSEDPTSILSALQVFLYRLRSRKNARASRGLDHKRPWSLFIGFFLVLAILGALLPFLFGRIMVIETFIRNQQMVYNEVLIAGDLSKDDLDRAKQFEGFPSFTQSPALLPYGITPPDYVEFAYGNDTVYFSKPSLSQFIPGGSGLGVFDPNRTASLKGGPNDSKLALSRNGNVIKDRMDAVIRYPQWGIRSHCKKLSDPKINLIPLTNESITYTFLPQDLLKDLFSGYGMDLPASLAKPDLRGLSPNDTIPPDIDPSRISYFIKWWQNGIAHSFHSRLIDTGPTSHQGWTTVETVLIRLNTSFTPSGRFPVYSNAQPDAKGMETRIGYDAAVCVERYEPWIIEAYNTSVGFPTWTILRVVEKGYGNTPSPSGKIRGDPIPNTRYLNTTGKNHAFFVLHDIGIDQMLKDNGRDSYYVPSLIDVSFTDSTVAGQYTELSPDRIAIIRARVGAANILPYLAGSAPVVAQSYLDQTLAYTTFEHWQLITLLVLILILGIIGELFVPTLPRNMPRRGLGMYSWLTLFRSQEFQFEVDHEADFNKMSLEEIEKALRDVKVKFVEKVY